MAKRRKLSPAQVRARKEASKRLKMLNAARRSEATRISRAAKAAADREAATINRQARKKTRAAVARRADMADDANFW